MVFNFHGKFYSLFEIQENRNVIYENGTGWFSYARELCSTLFKCDKNVLKIKQFIHCDKNGTVKNFIGIKILQSLSSFSLKVREW